MIEEGSRSSFIFFYDLSLAAIEIIHGDLFKNKSLEGLDIDHLELYLEYMTTQYRYSNTLVHISSIKAGDIVEIDGKHHTVNQNHIKRDSFVGTTLFGNSYRLGTLPVMKVNILTKGMI